MLEQIALFLAAAVFIVPLFKKLGLGTAIGYLVAGILIGPFGLRLVTDVDSILHFSELGVVLLLFIIGLELQPSRLWVLRRAVFGLGSAQVGATTVLVACAAWLLGQGLSAALIIGAGLAMSSTAFVLQTLAERNELTTRHGREAFSILLFQDLAVIPLLAILPMLAIQSGAFAPTTNWIEVLRGVAVIALMIAIGRQVLRLLFRAVAHHGNREIFTAAALLVVIATALLMSRIGLSMPLGAFIAGVLLSDSEFRHELEAALEPFKGLLLGLFFIAVGMSVNMSLIQTTPWTLCGLVLAMLAVKFVTLFAISRFSSGNANTARNLGIAMAGGGEFAFVLFTLARQHQLIADDSVDILMVVVALSLMSAPFLFLLNDKVLSHWAKQNVEPEYDSIDEAGNPVIIFGFGRVGQVIGRILYMRGIKFTALEINPAQVDFVRKFGNKIYYGDATRLDLLRSAKVESAKLCVLAINNIEASIQVAELLRKHYPNIPIYARARNRLHCYKLMDMGVQIAYRDTFYSSLALAKSMLLGLGFAAEEAERMINLFRDHDETLLKQQHAVHQNEQALVEIALKSRAELQSLFESDASERKRSDWAE